MFKSRSSIVDPLLGSNNTDQKKKETISSSLGWEKQVEEKEALEPERIQIMRRSFKQNYKKYSVFEDENAKAELLASRTKYEIEQQLDLELTGFFDCKEINQFTYKNQKDLDERGEDNCDKIHIEPVDQYEEDMAEKLAMKNKAEEKEIVPDEKPLDKKGSTIDILTQSSNEQIVNSVIEKQQEFDQRRLDQLPLKKQLKWMIHLKMLQDLANKKSLLMSDSKFLPITCNNATQPHQMEIVKPHPIATDKKKPQCSMCKQTALNDQLDGYYKCSHINCDPEYTHKDICKKLIHLKCEQSYEYILCRSCALNETKNLDKIMKVWFHDHELKRHPIRNYHQWTCHCETPEMQEKLNDAGKRILAANPQLEKRMSAINPNSSMIIDQQAKGASIYKPGTNGKINCLTKLSNVADTFKHQGYECTVCDFDVCVNCLYEFGKKTVPPKNYDKIDKNNGSVSKKDERNKCDIQTTDKKLKESVIISQNMQIAHCRTVDEEAELIKGKKPDQIFKAYQDDFIQRCLVDDKMNKIRKNEIKIRSFYPHDDDIKNMLSHLPLQASHTHPYEIKHKEMQLIQKVNSTEFYIVVKTIEVLIHDQILDECHNLIKTIRIVQYNAKENKFEEKKSILLEQIAGHTYDHNQVKYNQISLLENDYKIYFWRRRLTEKGDFQMQLWRYDPSKDDEVAQVKYTIRQNSRDVKVDNYSFACLDEVKHDHTEEKKDSESSVGTMLNSFGKKVSDAYNSAKDKLVGKAINLKGSGQLHFVFASAIGNIKWPTVEWSLEEIQENKKKIDSFKAELNPDKQPDELKNLISAEQKNQKLRLQEKKERFFLDKQYILKQYYFPEKSEYQVKLEEAERLEKIKAAQKEKEEKAAKDCKAEGQAEEEKHEEGEEQKEEDIDVTQEQEFYIAQLSNLKEDIVVEKNKNSHVPICQFFLSITEEQENRFTEEEMKKRRAENIMENEKINFLDVTLTATDNKPYLLRFFI